jgi:uncharacterized protein (TIGR02001 family)
MLTHQTLSELEKAMRLNKLALALSLSLFALPLTVMAQDTAAAAEPAAQAETTEAAPAAEAEAEAPASNLSWNLSVTSDYVFRGITQTDFDPALQGGVDYAFGDSGWYIGVWGSNIDFASTGSPDIEIDAYAGFATDLSEDWNLDLHAIRYFYIGEDEDYGSLDYNEYFAKITYAEMINFTVAYANDYANADVSSTYYALGGNWEVGNGFGLNASYGHSSFSGGWGSYDDWNLGVSRSFGPVEAALNYYDTSGGYVDDLFGGDNASDTFVISFKIGG